MEAKAIARNIRVSPRKVRLVLDLIRGQNVVSALGYLTNVNRSASLPVKTLLKSAIANSDQKNENIDVDSLIVKTAFADEGPSLKRFQPRAMGRAGKILKRTSHITIVVDLPN